jgi:hypothetical protein
MFDAAEGLVQSGVRRLVVPVVKLQALSSTAWLFPASS